MTQPLVLVVGPTATGKSDLAVSLALALDAEVVSADSMQVYRGFDIGTGKVTDEEMRGVPHHLIDVADPDEHFSAARFVELADRAISEIHARGRPIVVAGGTGLYLKALVFGLFEAPAVDPRIRRRHQAVCEAGGVEVLHRELQAVDSEAAARISPRDGVRISRALEVYEQTGSTISELQRAHSFSTRRFESVQVGLLPPRTILRERIDRRVDMMMDQGWLQEVEELRTAGHGASHPMGALGYRQLNLHLDGGLDLAEAVRQTKRDTWRFARRQINWFRATDDICWYEQAADVDVGQVLLDLKA